MIRRLAGIAIAGLSLVCVVLLVTWESAERTSPGPLHSAHRDVPQLQGTEGCALCHSSGDRDLASNCIECHDAIATRIERRVGLHGAGEEQRLRDCGVCHIEHVDGAIPLVGPHAFRIAGVESPDEYDHRHVDAFGLVGRHAALDCDACHDNADVSTLPRGAQRFLGLSQDCTSCHEDPHAREFGSDCASCHGQERPFAVVAKFAHDPRFELVGAHAGVACQSCHAAGTLGTELPISPVRACAECHSNPHVEGDAGAHRSLRLGPATRDCAACHDTRADFESVRFAASDHASWSFALTGPHATAECAACHGDAERPARWPAATPAPAAQECAACHESPHRPEFVARAARVVESQTDRACAACHEFEDPTFSVPHAELRAELHASSGFALEVPHADVACAGCHPRGDLGFDTRYPGRDANACGICHQDPHDGQFDRPGPAPNCIDCHERHRFSPSTFDSAAHAASDFPLDGAHLAVACSECHRPALRVRDVQTLRFRGTSRECADCHDDPHAGRFDADGRPASVEGHSGCARCHTTRSFEDVDWKPESHRRWTDFDLRGAHADVSCAACHGRPFVGPTPNDCAACHTDVHAGQFVAQGVNDCARCHTESATSFRDLTFDHDRDTRFRLDDNHARLACSACHRERRTRDGRSVVHYRPLGRDCGDCHSTGTDR